MREGCVLSKMASEHVEKKDPKPSPWPNSKDDYELLEVIGSGATAVVQVGLCKSRNEKVAIKRIDLEQYKSSFTELQKEINLMSHCNHPNVMTYRTSFVVKHELWLIMKLMSGGSLLDIIKHVKAGGAKNGVLDEVVIATVLREVLQGIDYFHTNGQIHRDIKAGNVLVGDDGSIKISDFGVGNWLYGEAGALKQRNPRFTFVGTPCWMAPEVMDQSVGYDTKADIWSFGIMALELATGSAPYAKFPPMKVLMLTLENPSPTLETCSELNGEDYRKTYSKAFSKMIDKCLQKDPAQRPSAAELLRHPFFKKAKNNEFIKEVVLGQTPSLSARAKKVKRVPGTSGRLHRTEDGGWVWSDEEMSETYTAEDEHGKNNEEKTETKSSSQLLSVPSGSSPSVPSPSPSPTHANSVSVDIDELKGELQTVQSSYNALQQQITDIRNEEQKLMTEQIQNPALLSDLVHQQKAMDLLQSRQVKEREHQQLVFKQQQVAMKIHQLSSQQQQQPSDTIKPIEEGVSNVSISDEKPIKIVLCKRADNGQLKKIKFDFVNGKDTADSVAKDLVEAGLVEMREHIVVAANIQKLVDNPEQKVTFQLGNTPPEQLDDKKLIGYAQLFVS